MARTLSQILSFFLLAICMLTISCGGRRLMKDAAVLERGGLYEEASLKYNAAYTEYDRAEGLVGMKRSTQAILDAMIADARLRCMSDHHETALTLFEQAFDYERQHNQLQLQVGTDVRDAYGACKISLSDKLYQRAETAVLSGDYSLAHDLIGKMLTLNRDDERARFLATMCEILPSYNAGKDAMELGLWREAYIHFNEVCALDASYKDALPLRDKCLEKGRFAVAYLARHKTGVPITVEDALATSVKGDILRSKNPFIDMLERDNLDVVVLEQQYTLNPEFESGTGPEPGKFHRASYLLIGEFVHFDQELSSEQQTRCDCASQLGIHSAKVDCYEIARQRSLTVSYKYQLIDAETGKLYMSDIIPFTASDNGLRYEYEIQKKISITSPTLTREHEVDLSKLKNTVPDALMTEQDLILQMNAAISYRVAQAMNNFRP